eukprot:CAMPEP_0174333854 /NCGR_PEP_ID=MMETSP0810-20121108/19473_1 /TAXON_ID=73025 ORGANISM="Eutreptiella gymnastica-like, Strain CCMP1594" /NCGR_SAMPLE_ID=MMETSP0810 /ASSEMBLY_ACC=CAM_ASM_000659 /LENGTH=56 /DNA_ID=CAMNT_0015451197 /DNA_START=1175 /DNA_END=1345 /DNA_ORIENTATION=-
MGAVAPFWTYNAYGEPTGALTRRRRVGEEGGGGTRGAVRVALRGSAKQQGGCRRAD